MKDELFYQIALKKLEGIGPARAKALVSYCGGVEQVFKASKRQLAAIPGIGTVISSQIDTGQAYRLAEAEIKFIEKNEIKPLFYLDPQYPRRLKHCDDGPILIYTKGQMILNPTKVVSIVGTRTATDYGRKLVDRLIDGLKPHNALIVSGLAYGIDAMAHKAALNGGLQTVGVMGNSLDRVYPNQHKSLTEKMLENGGLISEFEHGTKPDRENFPQRNRIVAGMSDVCVVVESAVKGGSMITARLAAGYNRDVMAFPGAADAPNSSGCNHLIKTQQAHLIEGIKDLEYIMGWEHEDLGTRSSQKQLFVELTDEEQKVYERLKETSTESLDNISLNAGLPVSKASTLLLEMEFKGVVKSLPGKVYTLA
ncbi:MAG TPA: DNA-protecting protein DprA [Flavobacteriales bacterium]|jgi:DNA processing protein|nr:DNA-processing protein DprA [Flavobacteriales bacterium]HAW20446.1 DNA-protecting protein DprA [Flavobacteriales bacterium]